MRLRTSLPVLALVVCLLTGCVRTPAERIYEYEGLTLTLSPAFTDLSKKEAMKDFTFAFCRGEQYVLGFREDKASLQKAVPGMDLQTYGEMIIKWNGLTEDLQELHELYFFEYNSPDSTDSPTVCLSAVYETETAYWTVQTAFPAASADKDRTEMWEILCNIQTK